MYPLPLMHSDFEFLQGVCVFSKLDLCYAYHLVQIREGNEWKMAFNTPLGHLVMPFWLTNAPATFQALVNNVLRDFLNRFVFINLDGILIFSPSLSDHVCAIRQRLLENKLFVKAEKCDFHSQLVSFLGFVIQVGQIKADPEKVRAVVEWPRPTTSWQLQQFLSFAHFYCRFIRNYSHPALPLTQLTSTCK